MSSFWLDSVKNTPTFSSLDTNIKSDVCIVGAGLLGLTCGYYLSQNGVKVTIIDKNNIVEKVSGHTTAKITSQHNLIYKYLEDSLGIKSAKQYLDANQLAISNIKNIIDNGGVQQKYEFNNIIVKLFSDKLKGKTAKEKVDICSRIYAMIFIKL